MRVESKKLPCKTSGPSSRREQRISWSLVGKQGASGAQGATGATGATGTQGGTGAKGGTGAEGDMGADGAAGATGATGAQGSVGPKGETGAEGAVGASGAIGATGAKGETGAAGAKGETGPAGAKGDIGAMGATGPKGDIGPSGSPNTKTWQFRAVTSDPGNPGNPYPDREGPVTKIGNWTVQPTCAGDPNNGRDALDITLNGSSDNFMNIAPAPSWQIQDANRQIFPLWFPGREPGINEGYYATRNIQAVALDGSDALTITASRRRFFPTSGPDIYYPVNCWMVMTATTG